MKLSILLSCLIFTLSCTNKKLSISEKAEYTTLEKSIKEWTESGELMGAEVLVIENNKETFHRSFGWADKESGKKLENGSIWAVMSMAKPITATAVLMLMEDGKLSLDDPILKYFPEFKGNSQITIRHLLEQSSGDDGKHGSGGHNVVEFESLDEWINDWAMQESSGSFGEFAYSNFNYGALAYIVEKASGQSIEKYISDHIITPLGLKQTYVKFSINSDWAQNVPSRYQWSDSLNRFERFWTNRQQPSWAFYSGSLGLWTTAKDYATFMQIWLNKGKFGTEQILEESTVEEALKLHVKAYGEGHFGHGYGWFIEDDPLVFRYGGSAGSLAKAIVSENRLVVYMTHCGNGKHKSSFEDQLDKMWFPNEN
ncbi:serine hydrolase domain-containing protein [Aestuariivivens sediminis]|uniref:serine hydrolase domain-containing protein n=1 Tax=Aestuariivivens sediminis TaxID=2913557 RepID=UPI001F58093B|nr:serine hydrolase domain-containing protein [Aestuariivivens sediminis]